MTHTLSTLNLQSGKAIAFIITWFFSLSMSFAQDNEILQSRRLELDINSLARELRAAPLERTTQARSAPLEMVLPTPDGLVRTFRIVESPILHPDFANQYPDFKTYAVQEVGDPTVTGRVTLTPYGYNAVILSNQGMIHARPLDILNPRMHEISLVNFGESPIECAVLARQVDDRGIAEVIPQSFTNGNNKRTYRIAVVGTGEFHAANGGSIPAASAVVTASVNGIQAIFERELSVSFQLLLPFIYTNFATDPFTPGGPRVEMAASAVAANFAANTYDFGHVFHDTNQGPENLGGGGVAGLGVICSNDASGTGLRKGGGWSGSFDNFSPGWIKLATHEIGHMFNMTHTFNGTGGFGDCTGNIDGASNYEIGSGNTIMSYQGTCQDAHNIPNAGVADHYFHANSLERAINYMNSQTCHVPSATGNNTPVANANPCGGGHTIPIGTPFRLTGAGTDADGDALFYCWEQYDEDGAGAPTQGMIGATAAANATAPLFRSFPPTPSPSRTFPNIDLVKSNSYNSSFEPLPTVARTLNFRLTVRDWKAGGGAVHSSDLAVTVSANGPLSVTAPNGGENLNAGNNLNVTWTLNNTNSICPTVNIKLSVDGGTTYPYVLAAGTGNDGSENVVIPTGVANTTGARIMVESACNECVVFFDISNANFTINSTCLAAISNICPTQSMSFNQGDGGLNLGLNRFFGGTTSIFSYNITGANPQLAIANNTSEHSGVCQSHGPAPSQSYQFTVSVSGKYVFQQTSGGGFLIFSLFQGAFNNGTPCTGFLGSNSWGGFSGGGGPSVNLDACTVYTLVAWSCCGSNLAGTITGSGPGEIFLSNPAPGAGYNYTYAAVNTTNNQVVSASATSNFTGLPAGTYRIYGVSYYTGTAPPTATDPNTWTGQTVNALLTGGACLLFSNNFKPVTVIGACVPPTINAPTVTQPTCVSSGIIVVNATGGGTLEYSINNGTTFQVSNTFNNLNPGAYNIVVRIQGTNCQATYNMNPVNLAAPMGCDNCLTFTSTDVPKNIVDNMTISSVINVAATATISDVNIRNVTGTHTWVNDLTFTLMSPQGTSVVLIANQCGDVDNFNFSLDDQAVNAFSCPMNDGTTEKPQNVLSAFNGQNAQGNWTLMINDNAGGDVGILTGWALEICGNFSCNPTITQVNLTQPTCQQGTASGTITITANGNSTLEYSIDNGASFQASNTFNNVPVGAYNVIVRLQANPACQTVYVGNPVSIVAPQNCETCLMFNAPGLPLNITDLNTISSIINFNRGGTITGVKVRNLMATHTYVGDLTFTLMSPQGTSVVLFANQCSSADNVNITFDDANATAFACPVNDGSTKKPQNPMTAFNGQNPQGNWTLQVNDNADQDVGTLNGWTLEVCGNFTANSCPPNLDINYTVYVSSGTYQAQNEITCVGTIPTGSQVVLKAGNNMQLLPNFEILHGCTLEMIVEGCGN